VPESRSEIFAVIEHNPWAQISALFTGSYHRPQRSLLVDPHPHCLLRIDPAQRHRLEEIRGNLHARIAEAEREGWTGEAEGLKVSLAAGIPVDLRDTVTGLDACNTDRLITAIRHATGKRPLT
jgi:hypothetical protein